MSGSSLFVPPHRFRRGVALTLVFGGVLATGGIAGSWGDDARNPARTPGPSAADGDLENAASTADRQALEAAAHTPTPGQSGSQAAEDVVSRSGDRWSAVYSEREYEDVRQTLDGWYVGVGLWVGSTADGRIEVTRARPDSPAERAGIRPGDRLLSIDDTPADGQPVTDIVALLRGNEQDARAGSTVDLVLKRDGRTWRETLHRARLAAESVSDERRADGTTVIRVRSFTKGSGDEVRHAVTRARGGSGILLDLRGNSGGLVSEAVTAASAFLDGGLVATYDVRGEERSLYARHGAVDTTVPLVVLVDSGTVSSAELLTGALQDRGRAVVVGTRTFGKGSVQMPEELPDGSVAELTVGHYRTPSGRTVDGRGITPDLVARDGAVERAGTVLTGLGGGS